VAHCFNSLLVVYIANSTSRSFNVDIPVAKKRVVRKKQPVEKASKPRSFGGVLKGRSKSVRTLAHALRDVVFEESPNVQESFYGGQQPMAMYRTTAEIFWIQPLTSWCNVYFLRGPELTDEQALLEGKSDRM